MNQQHALEILKALEDWYEHGDSGPSASAQLLGDDATLKAHITAALGGISLELTYSATSS